MMRNIFNSKKKTKTGTNRQPGASTSKTDATAPSTSGPAPKTVAPAPSNSAPAPKTEGPVPNTSGRVSKTAAPAPSNNAPAPNTSGPASKTAAPAPKTVAPAPSNNAPAPKTNGPVPNTDGPSRITATDRTNTPMIVKSFFFRGQSLCLESNTADNYKFFEEYLKLFTEHVVKKFLWLDKRRFPSDDHPIEYRLQKYNEYQEELEEADALLSDIEEVIKNRLELAEFTMEVADAYNKVATTTSTSSRDSSEKKGLHNHRDWVAMKAILSNMNINMRFLHFDGFNGAMMLYASILSKGKHFTTPVVAADDMSAFHINYIKVLKHFAFNFGEKQIDTLRMIDWVDPGQMIYVLDTEEEEHIETFKTKIFPSLRKGARILTTLSCQQLGLQGAILPLALAETKSNKSYRVLFVYRELFRGAPSIYYALEPLVVGTNSVEVADAATVTGNGVVPNVELSSLFSNLTISEKRDQFGTETGNTPSSSGNESAESLLDDATTSAPPDPVHSLNVQHDNNVNVKGGPRSSGIVGHNASNSNNVD